MTNYVGMVHSMTISQSPKKRAAQHRYRRLASMGKGSAKIVSELYSPIDSTNRFINLALQSSEEHSQSRQFLIESKQGIRKTSELLKKLSEHMKSIEKEIEDIAKAHGQ